MKKNRIIFHMSNDVQVKISCKSDYSNFSQLLFSFDGIFHPFVPMYLENKILMRIFMWVGKKRRFPPGMEILEKYDPIPRWKRAQFYEMHHGTKEKMRRAQRRIVRKFRTGPRRYKSELNTLPKK